MNVDSALLRRWAPFLAIIAAQAVLIAVIVPSDDGSVALTSASGGSFSNDVSQVPVYDSATGQTIPVSSGSAGFGGGQSSSGRVASSGGAATGAAAAPGAAPVAAAPGQVTVPGQPQPGPAPAGDLSHCTDRGLQQGVTSWSSPCVPKFVGDNGGATYKGVDATTVKAVMVRNSFGPAVDGALASGGLAATPEEEEASMQDFAAFFNKHYEGYGRTVDWTYHLTTCDAASELECARTEARRIVQTYKPFIVVTSLQVVAEYHDELSKLGVVNIGGWHQGQSFYERLAPFHYDWMPDGNRIAKNVASYWCQKLGGKNATKAGDISYRTQVRKLAIAGADRPEEGPVVKDLISRIESGCGAATGKIELYLFSAGADQAQQEFAQVAADMKQKGITTVICMCDPISMVFATSAFTNQAYFPEHVLSGMGAVDHDYFGRLYEPRQWANAFGPGIQPQNTAAQDQDDARAYRDVGKEYRCFPCLANFFWMHQAHIQIQAAGPNLNPLTIQAGTQALPEMGGVENTGNPIAPLVSFRDNSFTGIADSMEVYWDATATSEIDGRPGSYVCVQPDCRRYRIGAWPASEPLTPT